MDWPAWLDGASAVLDEAPDVLNMPALLDLLDWLDLLDLRDFVALLELLEGGPGGSEGGSASDGAVDSV